MSIAKGNFKKSTGSLVHFKNQLNNFTDDKKENELKLPNCKYRDTDYFKNLTKDFKRKVLSCFFHMNVCLLTKTFGDLNILHRKIKYSS